MDVADKLQGCPFSHENGNKSVNQCMKRIFNRMGEVTLTPVPAAVECTDANHSLSGSTLQAENDLISYSLRVRAAEQGLFLTVLGAITMALTARKVCLRRSGLRLWGNQSQERRNQRDCELA